MPQITESQMRRLKFQAMDAQKQLHGFEDTSRYQSLQRIIDGDLNHAETNYAKPYNWVRDRIKKITRWHHEELERRKAEPKVLRDARKLKGQDLVEHVTRHATNFDSRINSIREEIKELEKTQKNYYELKYRLLSILREKTPNAPEEAFSFANETDISELEILEIDD